MYKILIIDDEIEMLHFLSDYMKRLGYETITAGNTALAEEEIKKRPDLILLDVYMPGEDGFSFCKRIREMVNCPIIFLTAMSEEENEIRGFMAGGDDYITKPFSINELRARIAAHLRREERIKKNNVKLFGKITVDYDSKNITIDGEEIRFTNAEYLIIEYLSINEGVTLNKEKIYEEVMGSGGFADNSVVVEHIRKIRSKLKQYGEGYHIETIWGIGYRWIR